MRADELAGRVACFGRLLGIVAVVLDEKRVVDLLTIWPEHAGHLGAVRPKKNKGDRHPYFLHIYSLFSAEIENGMKNKGACPLYSSPSEVINSFCSSGGSQDLIR